MALKNLSPIECNNLRRLRKHSRHITNSHTLSDDEVEKKISQLVNCIIRKIDYTACKQRYGFMK